MGSSDTTEKSTDQKKNNSAERFLDNQLKINLELTDEEKKVLREVKVVALEGVDKTGKTTLFEKASKVFGERGSENLFSNKSFIVWKTKGSHLIDSKVVCFVRSIGHRRFYNALSDFIKNDSNVIVKRKKEGIADRLSKCDSNEVKKLKFKKEHPFSEEMFSFFYQDYISLLKKLVRMIGKYKVDVILFDRSWISNYVYNTHYAVGHKEEDDASEEGYEFIADGLYKLKINHLILLDHNRLGVNGTFISKNVVVDYFETRTLQDGSYREILDKYYRFFALKFEAYGYVNQITYLYDSTYKSKRSQLSFLEKLLTLRSTLTYSDKYYSIQNRVVNYLA